jgi:LuxR family transcriptional activator of conjugal transfer of Ti plasmids
MPYTEQLALADLCDDLRASHVVSEMEQALTRFVRRSGFEWFAYIAKSQTDVYGSSSYPADYQSLYVQRNYVNADPVLAAAARSPLPTKWRGEEYRHQKAHRALFATAADFNIRNGVVIPIAGVYGSFVSLSLAGFDNDNASPAFNENIPILTLAALHYHMQVNRVLEQARSADQDATSLSPRAKICLTWIARGKTIDETASILNIHEATVRYHLNDARRRLGATSLPHLVAEALKRGEIVY